jgi:D-alanyl-D-alanine carboxypeptidase/D-alanyl-D-alanine-endopeptidase (penicillin-binding protein 4)
MALVCLIISTHFSASGATLAQRINSILASRESRQTLWGIHVVDAQTGKAVYRHNEQNFFIPASNTKLFTTALALMRLGPDHRFTTTVVADSRPDAEGRVSELRLVGGGDPNLSARVIPYKRNETKSSAFEEIDALANAVVAAGVRSISGDVVGDDTAYFWEPFPEGWAIADAAWEYGSPVSALTVNDGAFYLNVDPAPEAGQQATLSLKPDFEHLTIHNRTQTIAYGETRIEIERVPGSRELTVSGNIVLGAKTNENLVAVDDPAEFAAHVLRDALLRRGVRIAGVARAFHRREGDPTVVVPGFELARHQSEPLIEILRVINKVSQNLHAEIVLREVARSKDGVGSRKRGLEELAGFLTEIGIPEKQYDFRDGSGLSRMTLVTPATTTRLLTFMYGTPHREAWISTLPIAGEDGTLFLRFDQRARPAIRAKTGSISHVSSLAGYAQRRNGQRYAFAIMANNYNLQTRVIRRLIDRIALAMIR